MRKILMALALSMLVIPIVHGTDEELFLSNFGDSQLYVLFGDFQFNNFFTSEITETPPAEEPTGGGGITRYTEFAFGMDQVGVYDVIVEVEENSYEPGDNVTAVITLKNNGDTPDRDAILTYYLTSPSTTLHQLNYVGMSQEQLIEVPPTDYYGSECSEHGGELEGDICLTRLRRTIYIPPNSIKGEWRFNVEYDTEVQPTILVYDVFLVIGRYDLLILLVLLWLYNEHRKKQKKAMKK